MSSDRLDDREPIGVRLVGAAGFVLLVAGLRRWSWLTDRWYPAEWSRGWLGLAGFVLICIFGVLHLRYREPPFSKHP